MTEVPPPADESVPEQMRVRREKLDRLRAAGVDPYPVGFPRTTTIAELRSRYADLPTDTATGDTVAVTGRVLLSRIGGKLCFATIRDGSGTGSDAEIQVMVSLAGVGEEALAAWKADVDLGDHIGVEGEVITSRRGELSVLASRWQLTAKALRPLPDKHKGLTDVEARVRQRYVDLIVNPDARRMLETRAAVVRSLRSSLTDRGFLEVETPMLQPIQGGASARPFRTHMNALDLPLFLRIAPELYLKRLVVGGIEKVFEINRNFRNEGVSTKHNPEFTMLEFYEAYGDYDSMARITRELVVEAAKAALGTTVVTGPDGAEHDLGAEWRSVGVFPAISEALGEEVGPAADVPALQRLCDAAAIPYDPAWGAGQIVLEMYERLCESRTVAPTFYRDFPADVSPLTRQHRDDPRLAERWDLVAFGREVGTGYSELVDPVEQRARLVEQARRAAGGDAEAMGLDEDFLRALEYGMPPSGGVGVGVERLLLTLTGATSIRETIAFPLVRPE